MSIDLGNEPVGTPPNAAQRKQIRDAIGLKNVVIASDTLVSDAALERGSATFGTNQTAAAQAILDLAQSGPLHVIWDVAISCTGLIIYSNTTIEARPNCGAILRTNSNKQLLSNANPTAGTIVDENITIDGGIWNGNGAVGQQVHDNVGDGWICGIRMMGVRNVCLKNLQVLQTRTFAVHFANWQRVVCENIYCDNFDNTFNHDGLHFNGPGRWLYVSNLSGYVDDDLLALNANDITSQDDGSGSVYGPHAGAGDITDVFANGISLQNGKSGVRLLSSMNRLDRVQIRGVTGSSTSQAVIIDTYSEGNWRMGPPGNGNFGSILLDGIECVLTGIGYKECVIWVQANVESLRIKNVSRNDFSINRPTLKVGAEAVIGQLVLEGWVSRSELFYAPNTASQIQQAGRIASMQVLGCNFGRTDGLAAGSPIVNSGVISQLQIADCQSGGFASMLTNSGTITTDNTANSQNDALPSGWVLESGFGSANIYEQTELLASPPAATVKIAASSANDAFSGDVRLSAEFIHQNFASSYLFLRGTNTGLWSTASAYVVALESDGKINLYKHTAGTSVSRTTLTAVAVSGTSYRLFAETKTSGGNVIVNAYLQRISDGYFINSSKVWIAPSNSTPPVAATFTDTTSVFSGSGKYGITVYNTILTSRDYKNIITYPAY